MNNFTNVRSQLKKLLVLEASAADRQGKKIDLLVDAVAGIYALLGDPTSTRGNQLECLFDLHGNGPTPHSCKCALCTGLFAVDQLGLMREDDRRREKEKQGDFELQMPE